MWQIKLDLMASGGHAESDVWSWSRARLLCWKILFTYSACRHQEPLLSQLPVIYTFTYLYDLKHLRYLPSWHTDSDRLLETLETPVHNTTATALLVTWCVLWFEILETVALMIWYFVCVEIIVRNQYNIWVESDSSWNPGQKKARIWGIFMKCKEEQLCQQFYLKV